MAFKFNYYSAIFVDTKECETYENEISLPMELCEGSSDDSASPPKSVNDVNKPLKKNELSIDGINLLDFEMSVLHLFFNTFFYFLTNILKDTVVMK